MKRDESAHYRYMILNGGNLLEPDLEIAHSCGRILLTDSSSSYGYKDVVIKEKELGGAKYDNNILIHCCNSGGHMGAGVAKALYEKWPDVRNNYKTWYKNTVRSNLGEIEIDGDYNYFFPSQFEKFDLGNVQLFNVEYKDKKGVCHDLTIGNIIGQRNIVCNTVGMPPCRYGAFDYAFGLLADYLEMIGGISCIHLPYLMGCDLARGKWEYVELILRRNFCDRGIDCKVYDLFGKYGEFLKESREYRESD